MWMLSGRIIINAARVYYLPDSSGLPPLRWQSETQRFVYLRSDSMEDAMMRRTLEDLADSAQSPMSSSQRPLPGRKGPATPGGGLPGSSMSFSTLDSMSNIIACECLYGVVPIGGYSSALLYVTKRSHVTAVSLPEQEDGEGGPGIDKRRHDVYAVREMKWLPLPSRVSRAESALPTPMRGPQDLHPGNTTNSGSNSNSKTNNRHLHGCSDDEEDSASCISPEVVEEYLKVIDRFCRQVSARSGEESYLYYSPTLNLALSPEELLQGRLPAAAGPPTATRGPAAAANLSALLPPTPLNGTSRTRSSSRVDDDDGHHAPSSRSIFQWNSMLLGAFALPRSAAELENDVNLAASTQGMRGNSVSSDADTAAAGSGRDDGDKTGAATPLTLSFPWSCVLMTDHAGQRCFNAAMLYVPCFIRGLVAAYDIKQEQPSTVPTLQLHLVTRLSCRWSGTRYNRRGLEPSNSGVPANCAVTSLWVSSTTSGSRRWERDRDTAPADATTTTSQQQPPRERVAVFSLLRGSVPRRWEQPADLHFKPPLRILFPNNGADELFSHLRFLQTILPNLEKVSCIDTTSTSWLEAPLSEAFATAVAQAQREMMRSIAANGADASDPAVTATAAAAAHAGEDAASTAAGAEQHLAEQAARNAAAPLAYLKFNMKQKLKRHTYGSLRRDVLEQLAEQNMGRTQDSVTAAHAGGRLPAWLDFTQCAFQVTAPQQRSHERAASASRCVLRPQGLYYRVNCLDCLDRTNLWQALLCESALPYLVRYVLDIAPAEEEQRGGAAKEASGVVAAASSTTVPDDRLHVAAATALRRLLGQQGVTLSQMYAHSDAHFLSFLLAADEYQLNDNNENARYGPSLEEGKLALRRWYFQNFCDGRKQDAVSLATLQHDPALYPSDIESPFSRDLSSMNNLVMYGIIFAFAPMCFSVISAFFVAGSSRMEMNFHTALCVAWVLYLAFLVRKLSKYRVSYTNQPLLGYTAQ